METRPRIPPATPWSSTVTLLSWPVTRLPPGTLARTPKAREVTGKTRPLTVASWGSRVEMTSAAGY